MSVIDHTLTLVSDLLDGREHDRHSIAGRVGVKLAAADRYIRHIKKKVRGIQAIRRGRMLVLRLESARPRRDIVEHHLGLLPCPHCGGRAEPKQSQLRSGWVFWVQCKKCKATVAFRRTEAAALKAWNRRWAPRTGLEEVGT